MYEIEIKPGFKDGEIEPTEEYDDDAFMSAEAHFQTSLKSFLRKGARSDNVEHAIANVLNGEV